MKIQFSTFISIWGTWVANVKENIHQVIITLLQEINISAAINSQGAYNPHQKDITHSFASVLILINLDFWYASL